MIANFMLPDAVLIRISSGPEVEIFHHPQRPCGRVTGRGRFRSNFKSIGTTVAMGRGLQPCSGCRWEMHLGGPE